MSFGMEKWNDKYRDGKVVPQVADVLLENAHLLPKSGHALDLACGLGANSLFLSQQGLQVSAWDSSEEAIRQLNIASASEKQDVQAAVRDVIASPPESDTYDVIVVAHFLCRNLCSSLSAALKNNGLIFYQTFTADKITSSGPRNPDYLLGENELLSLFDGLRVLVYREEGRVGDRTSGWRNKAMLVAQKV